MYPISLPDCQAYVSVHDNMVTRAFIETPKGHIPARLLMSDSNGGWIPLRNVTYRDFVNGIGTTFKVVVA